MMGILDRINTLIKANINDLVRRADTPESALDGSIHDMEASTREARAQLRQVEQGEAGLLRKWERGREEALTWEDRAMEALREGDEALARECLMMKKRVSAKNARIREELEQQRAYLADLSRSLDALEVKLDSVRSRRRSISPQSPPADAPSAGSGGSSGGGRYTFPSFSGADAEPSAPRSGWDDAPPARRRRPPTAPAEDTFSQGRRAFVFDEDMRREFPEDVFGAGQPFDTLDRMEDRIGRMEADVGAVRELGGYEDPLKDDLEERFNRITRDRDTARDLTDLRRRLEDDSEPPPTRRSSGKSSLSDLRRRLAEDLDG